MKSLINNDLDSNSSFFTGGSNIQVFNSPLFPNTVSEATLGTLPLTMQQPCDLRDAMPCHWSPGNSHPSFT